MSKNGKVYQNDRSNDKCIYSKWRLIKPQACRALVVQWNDFTVECDQLSWNHTRCETVVFRKSCVSRTLLSTNQTFVHSLSAGLALDLPNSRLPSGPTFRWHLLFWASILSFYICKRASAENDGSVCDKSGMEKNHADEFNFSAKGTKN